MIRWAEDLELDGPQRNYFLSIVIKTQIIEQIVSTRIVMGYAKWII